MRRLLLSVLALITLVQTVHAQIQVGISIERRLFMMYEPVVATVTVTNRTGRDIPLSDADGQPWFSFNIVQGEGQPVAPCDPNYHLSPLTIPAGSSVKRVVDINSLYPVHDFGMYRVQAAIYFAPMQKFFVSSQANVEISEGKTIWQQTVGVPDGEKGAGGTRKLSLLTFRHSDTDSLYVRVEDNDTGAIFCTVPLGRLVGMEPQMQLDVFNHLHVLHVAAAKTYVYSQIGLNGEPIRQKTYTATTARPKLVRDKVGEVAVVGGEMYDENASKPGAGLSSAPGGNVPKLSDRPEGMPKD